MNPRVSTILGVLALILPFVTASRWTRRHQEVAHRPRGDVDVLKRQYYANARFTFYDVGLGACGQWNTASDFIVALNVEQYGQGYPGPFCFRSITISYGGKTAQAVIMDECMGCPFSGLDFSRGLFDFFASEAVGVIYGDWWFNGDSGGGGNQATSTWIPPSTTWEPPATTSTPNYTPPATSSTPDYTPSPTTSSTSSYISPSTTSSSHSNSNNSSTGGLAVPTSASASSVGNSDNIADICNILVRIGLMVFTAKEK